MRKLTYFISLVALTLAMSCHTEVRAQQLIRRPLDASQLGLDNPPVNLEKPSATAEIPADMPNHFDPGVFQQEEQTHDKLLDNLATRVGELESTSSWLKGAIGGIILIGGFIIGFFNKLWKWILTGALNELNPQILQPFSASPLPVASATPPLTR
jgi:hypothetical protein